MQGNLCRKTAHLFLLTGTSNVQCEYRFVNNGAKTCFCKETTHTCIQGMDLPYPTKLWQKFTTGQKFGKTQHDITEA
uniref:Secreted protein n=1 Tax=Romanomermis culicivorax TaxID=13658 RepID=A0A915KKE9_ROMCU